MGVNDIVFSTGTNIGYCITALVYLMLPIAAFFIMRKYNAATLLPVIAGIITYFLSTRLSDAVIHLVLFSASFAQKAAASAELVCITEEVGRWLAMKYPLSNVKTSAAAVCYGIGHAGLECWIRCVQTFKIIGYGQTLSTDGISAFTSEKSQKAAESITQQLKIYADNNFFYSILDQMSIFTNFGFHICLSLMIFRKMNENGFKKRWLLRAIILHYLLNVSVWLVSLTHIIILQKLTGIIVGIGIIIYVCRKTDIRQVIDEILYPAPQIPYENN